MAQTQKLNRTIPAAAVYGAAVTLLIALAVGLVLAFGAVRISVSQSPAHLRPLSPAQVEAGRQWQIREEEMGGVTTPLTKAGRAWELQQKQQLGASNE